MSRLMWNGEDDYITDEGLERLLELAEKLPPEFDGGTIQAHQRSVTVTLKFPGNDPITQVNHLENVLTASQFLGTLARNLKYERTRERGVS